MGLSLKQPIYAKWHFYRNSLDRSISYIRSVWLIFIIKFSRNI